MTKKHNLLVSKQSLFPYQKVVGGGLHHVKVLGEVFDVHVPVHTHNKPWIESLCLS